jgi:hypothetical protein
MPQKHSGGEQMTTGRKLVQLGVAAGAAVAALAFAAPQAVASTSAGGSVKGFSEEPTAFGTLTSCQNVFTGTVTAGGSQTVASIGQVSFTFCQADTSVTPAALPWTLKLSAGSYTIEGFDVNITTPRGTCRYSGTVDGVNQFPNVYDLRGLLTRRTADCGGPGQINIGNLTEVISVTA